MRLYGLPTGRYRTHHHPPGPADFRCGLTFPQLPKNAAVRGPDWRSTALVAPLTTLEQFAHGISTGGIPWFDRLGQRTRWCCMPVPGRTPGDSPDTTAVRFNRLLRNLATPYRVRTVFPAGLYSPHPTVPGLTRILIPHFAFPLQFYS